MAPPKPSFGRRTAAPSDPVAAAPAEPASDEISWRPILIGVAVSAAALLIAFSYLMFNAAKSGGGDLFWVVIATLPLLMLFGPTRQAVLNIARRKSVVYYLAAPVVASLMGHFLIGSDNTPPDPANSLDHATPVPSPSVQSLTNGGNDVVIPVGDGGHYFVNALVNGVPTRFLVDTGATVVALTPSDARHIGLPIGPGDFRHAVATANGMARIAPVQLRSVTVGPLDVANVDAAVMQQDGGVSLLGISFLRKLGSYEIRGNYLTLRR